MTLSRRDLGFGLTAIAGLAALPAAAQDALSAEDRATLAQAQTYLQNLTSAQGNFVETGAGGQRRTSQPCWETKNRSLNPQRRKGADSGCSQRAAFGAGVRATWR